MVTKILKYTAITLIFAGSFSSCWQEEPKIEYEVLSPCDTHYIVPPYPVHINGVLPWTYEVIDEWLQNGTHGRITRCIYRDGIGFLFESLGNNNFSYSFLTCDGMVLYEKEDIPIEVTYPELSIKRQFLLYGRYPFEGLECFDNNPINLPRVKELIYGYDKHTFCIKTVSICTYKYGIGILLGKHELKPSGPPYFEFLDCNGNLLCKSGVEGVFCPDLDVDISNRNIILETYISFNFNQ